MTDIVATSRGTPQRARDIAPLAGLKYVCTGNVHDKAGGTPYCPSCEEALVARDWHQIYAHYVTDTGACACGFCGVQLPGHWQKFGKPFGCRRLSVRLHPAA